MLPTSRRAMALRIWKRDRHSVIRNANFERVQAVVNRHLDESRIEGCACDRCVDAIIALALNCLPPHYHVSRDAADDIGSPWIMVENAVDEAVERLREYPNRRCRKARAAGSGRR